VENLERSASAMIADSQWESAAKVIESLLEVQGQDGGAALRARWQLKLAQIYADRLAHTERAVSLLFERMQSAPSPEVLSTLERLASGEFHPAEISEVLARHYGQSGDHQRQSAALLIGLSSAKDPAIQKQLLEALAGIHEKHLADTRGAFEFFLRALRLDPPDPNLRAQAAPPGPGFSAPAGRAPAEAELARALASRAVDAGDRALALDLLCAAAELAEEAGAIEEAVSALQLALERSPDDPQVLTRLVALYRKAGRLSECDLVLRRRIL